MVERVDCVRSEARRIPTGPAVAPTAGRLEGPSAIERVMASLDRSVADGRSGVVTVVAMRSA